MVPYGQHLNQMQGYGQYRMDINGPKMLDGSNPRLFQMIQPAPTGYPYMGNF